jgi:hypothetical protein
MHASRNHGVIGRWCTGTIGTWLRVLFWYDSLPSQPFLHDPLSELRGLISKTEQPPTCHYRFQ